MEERQSGGHSQRVYKLKGPGVALEAGCLFSTLAGTLIPLGI